MVTKYVRLLTYDNALKVIEWVMQTKENYAYITVGGVGVQMPEESFDDLEEFIKTISDRYEIREEHPTKVEERIVEKLKQNKVI